MTLKAQTLTVVALPVLLATAQAQTNQPAAMTTNLVSASVAATSLEQTLKDIKNPHPWFSWGGDFRLRNEYVNNAQSLTSENSSHSQDYFRFRGRLWAIFLPTNSVTLNVRAAAEPREWMEPSSAGTYLGDQGMEWRYGIIDNLNLQFKQPLEAPATITVGRQDIFMGDGWLIADGTPTDGSWTYYLDAARVTLNMDEQHTTVDAIGLVQYARPDAWLPTIGDSDGYFVTDQNEKGAILWVNNKSVKEANLDGYFIYKHDTPVSDPPADPNGDSADIYTLGGRVSGMLSDNWKYSGEGAYQFGDKKDPRLIHASDSETRGVYTRDIDAFGLNGKLAYLFKDSLNNQMSMNYEFLSGDDSSTGKDEMFDVLWGRWPRWSELYNTYSYIPETRICQTANLHRLGPGWSITPAKDLDFIFNYNVLFADQNTPTRASSPGLFGNGCFRGHYLQAVLKYKFSQHLSGHLWAEAVAPGDFYASEQLMTFLRAELLFTF